MGLMVIGMVISIVFVLLGKAGTIDVSHAVKFVRGINFSETLLHGMLAFLLFAGALGFEISLIYALLFGALISPTDPIAVLGILKKVGAPKSLELKITGESLFNDGIGVVVFLTILDMALSGNTPTASSVVMLVVAEIIGGVALGAAVGWGVYRLLHSVDAYAVEVVLTLALSAGVYVFAEFIHVSAPMAVVVAGLVIGNHGRASAMSS